MAIQNFIQEISVLAHQYCGDEFVRHVGFLRNERERILHNVWKADRLPERLDQPAQERIFRDIDFDTIIHCSHQFLGSVQYYRFLYKIAEISIRFGELEHAERLLKYLAEKSRGFLDKHFLAQIEQNLGNITFYRNEYKDAKRYYTRSLQIYVQLNDQRGIACLKNALGATMVEQGNLDKGEDYFKEARDIAAEKDFSEYLAKANMNLGNIYHMNGDYDNAVECYQAALEIVKKERKQDTIASIYNNIALAYKSKGDFSRAIEYLDKSLDLSKETYNRYTRAFSYLFQSEVFCYEGEFAKSTALVTSAFSIFSEIGDHLSMAEAYKILGMIHREGRRYDLAISYFENSIRINDRYQNLINLAEAQIELAKLYRMQEDVRQARKTLRAALSVFEKLGARQRAEYVNRVMDELPN